MNNDLFRIKFCFKNLFISIPLSDYFGVCREPVSLNMAIANLNSGIHECCQKHLCMETAIDEIKQRNRERSMQKWVIWKVFCHNFLPQPNSSRHEMMKSQKPTYLTPTLPHGSLRSKALDILANRPNRTSIIQLLHPWGN